MIRPSFLSSADRIELEACVRRQREDHGIARRANALLLLDDGKSCVEIAQVLYLDDDTVRGWHKQYLSEGWDAVAYDGWKGGQSRMKQAQEVALCAWLQARFCRSTVEIRAHVAAECGLNYSHSGCIKLLARLGFEYRKPKNLCGIVCNWSDPAASLVKIWVFKLWAGMRKQRVSTYNLLCALSLTMIGLSD